MNLKQAIKHLFNGKKITHETWNDKEYFVKHSCFNNIFLHENEERVYEEHILAALSTMQNPNKGWHIFNRKKKNVCEDLEVIVPVKVAGNCCDDCQYLSDSFCQLFNEPLKDNNITNGLLTSNRCESCLKNAKPIKKV